MVLKKIIIEISLRTIWYKYKKVKDKKKDTEYLRPENPYFKNPIEFNKSKHGIEIGSLHTKIGGINRNTHKAPK
jgi:hypothetical protein